MYDTYVGYEWRNLVIKVESVESCLFTHGLTFSTFSVDLLFLVLVARLTLENCAPIWEPLFWSGSQMHSLISELQKPFGPSLQLPSLLMLRHPRQSPWRSLERRHSVEPLQVWLPSRQHLQLHHFGAFQSGWHLSRAVFERSASWVYHRAHVARQPCYHPLCCSWQERTALNVHLELSCAGYNLLARLQAIPLIAGYYTTCGKPRWLGPKRRDLQHSVLSF